MDEKLNQILDELGGPSRESDHPHTLRTKMVHEIREVVAQVIDTTDIGAANRNIVDQKDLSTCEQVY